jgi:hypothetical protein
MSPDQAVRECVEAFAAGDWAACLQQVGRWCSALCQVHHSETLRREAHVPNRSFFLFTIAGQPLLR